MPKSGFMLFSKEKRPQVREENPDIKFGDIAKKLGAMWKELSEEEKKQWNERAAAEAENEPAEKKEKKEKKTKKQKKGKKEESGSEDEEKGGDDSDE